MAKAAAPYLHPQLSAVEVKQLNPGGSPLVPVVNITIEQPRRPALPSPDAGRMLSHLALTLGEALAGFAAGVLLGVLIAFGLATSLFLRRELQPLIVFSQSMPTAALAPLLVVWFGLGVAPKALLALLLVFFPVAANWLFLNYGHTATWSYVREVPRAPVMAGNLRLLAFA